MSGLLYCKFCDAPFYPDQRSRLDAHQLTCRPWESRVPGASQPVAQDAAST